MTYYLAQNISTILPALAVCAVLLSVATVIVGFVMLVCFVEGDLFPSKKFILVGVTLLACALLLIICAVTIPPRAYFYSQLTRSEQIKYCTSGRLCTETQLDFLGLKEEK